MKNLQKLLSHITKPLSDLQWRRFLLLILLLILPISLFLLYNIQNPFYYLNSLLFYNQSRLNISNPVFRPPVTVAELKRSRIAVCLVGGARRFELTGPSIVEKILEDYTNADLFVNSPLDSKSYKFSVLKSAPRIGGVRIFTPEEMTENETAVRVLTASNSPNGIQGLLQYFNLVEGCLTMVKTYQQQNNFTYDWIIRTRVDGYWSNRLRPDLFIPGRYVVPSGSSYGGLNDRFGVGDFNTSVAALSRLSMIRELDAAGRRELNSESAFQAQLKLRKIPYLTKRIPFCVVSDRTYDFPPGKFGVPVAAMSSKGPLSGVKCRPCKSRFSTRWTAAVINGLDREWSWTENVNGTLQLCDGHGEWEDGWEDVFDGVAGKKLAAVRKRVSKLSYDQCVEDFEIMKRRSAVWEVPAATEVCRRLR